MRVLIVSTDARVRSGLAALLAEQPEFTVEQADFSANLATTVAPHIPDVVIWGLSGDTEEISLRFPAIQDLDRPVLVVGDGDVQIAEAVAAGARGVLPSTIDGAALAAAVQGVVRGLLVVDPAFSVTIVPAHGGDETEILAEELTSRELEVLQLLAEGLPNRRIAQRLDISEHTVKFHVGTLLSKLGAHSRTEAVTRAARLGLIVL